MMTQVPTKFSKLATLTAQGKQSKRLSNMMAAQPRTVAISRRSLYALGLGLRLAFFFGLMIHAMTLWNQW